MIKAIRKALDKLYNGQGLGQFRVETSAGVTGRMVYPVAKEYQQVWGGIIHHVRYSNTDDFDKFFEEAMTSELPFDFEFACHKAWNDMYHKCKPDIPYDTYRHIWIECANRVNLITFSKVRKLRNQKGTTA